MNVFSRKSAMVLAVLFLLTSGAVAAQNTEGGREWKQGPPSVEDMLARMSEALELSDEQAVEMLVVLQQHAAEKAAMHEQTMALMGPEICAQRASAEEDILAILTPEQTEQFLQIREDRKARAEERNSGRGRNRHDCSQYETDG
mgnify:FL=1